MGFTLSELTAHRFAESRQTYTMRDTMLYALALGIGTNPSDPAQLQFVYERNLQALPTMGVVLAHPGFWAGDAALGIDWPRMLHVGQGITLHKPIPVSGTVIGRSRIVDMLDRGRDKGALLYYERDVLEESSGLHIATVRQTLLCRGNGAAAGEPASPAPPPTRPPPVRPQREADHVIDQRTLPQTALIYRLCGDMNPLHADPQVAATAGFPRPILHGLATFAIAAWAALQIPGAAAGTRLHAFDARFTAPVFPGETIRTRLWHEGLTCHLQCSVAERDTIVLDNGVALLAA